MALRRRKRNKLVAPAMIYFGSAKNEKGTRQLCTWAECVYSGTIAGPIWSHVDASVRRALATLTGKCDCGRPYHRRQYTEGKRVVVPPPRHTS
jgi:hypothetical protein